MVGNLPDKATVGGWAGPFRIGDYLRNVVRDRNLRPPDAPGVYVVSERSWPVLPNREAGILYIGQAQYLRYRIGQLLPDLFGFTSDDRADREAYEHRGGHSLWHRYCVEASVEPLNLYFAWCPRCRCLDCAEVRLLELAKIEWMSPVRRNCLRHHPQLDLVNNCSASVAYRAGSVRLPTFSRN
jgi:hypothetical protein